MAETIQGLLNAKVSVLLFAMELSSVDNLRVDSEDFPRHLDKTSDVFVLNIILSDGAVQGA
jgi:hypothetical protein